MCVTFKNRENDKFKLLLLKVNQQGIECQPLRVKLAEQEVKKLASTCYIFGANGSVLRMGSFTLQQNYLKQNE